MCPWLSAMNVELSGINTNFVSSSTVAFGGGGVTVAAMAEPGVIQNQIPLS